MAKTSNTANAQAAETPQASALLAWYDRHARPLPWRIAGGRAPSPYHTWLSEIMLQQTGVATVTAYYHRFIARWPDVAALAGAEEDDVLAEWAGLGYYSRARNLLKCARLVAEKYGGVFPSDVKTLLTLPGIGDYTANAIRAIAYDLPANVVDGNIERVTARVFAYPEPANIPKGKAALKALAATIAPNLRPGDYAQAAMDLGATICTPRKPACPLCPWRQSCRAFALGLVDTLPVMQRKPVSPVRQATAFVVRDEAGKIFLRKQPPTGLLGGLWMFPSTPWDKSRNDLAGVADMALYAPLPIGGFTKRPDVVTHVFTHFKLLLAIYEHGTPVATDLPIGDGTWFDLDALPALPTATKKIIAALRLDKATGSC